MNREKKSASRRETVSGKDLGKKLGTFEKLRTRVTKTKQAQEKVEKQTRRRSFVIPRAI